MKKGHINHLPLVLVRLFLVSEKAVTMESAKSPVLGQTLLKNLILTWILEMNGRGHCWPHVGPF